MLKSRKSSNSKAAKMFKMPDFHVISEWITYLSVAETNLGLDEEDDEYDRDRDLLGLGERLGLRETDRDLEPDLAEPAGLELRLRSDILVWGFHYKMVKNLQMVTQTDAFQCFFQFFVFLEFLFTDLLCDGSTLSQVQ